MGMCKKHGETVDIWYDCVACQEEADKWAQQKGYTHAVSPGKEDGDCGKWVHRNRRRWVFSLSEMVKAPVLYQCSQCSAEFTELDIERLG